MPHKPLNFLQFLILISRHITHYDYSLYLAVTQGHIPSPSTLQRKSTSSSVMTHSQHSCNNWLRVLCLNTNACLLYFWQTNHLTLYFIALLHKMHIFLYYWKFPLTFFIFIRLEIDYKPHKYKDHFFQHFWIQLSAQFITVKSKSTSWMKAYLGHWMQKGKNKSPYLLKHFKSTYVN